MTLSVTIKEQQSIQIHKLFEYDFSSLRQDMGWHYVQDDMWEFFLNQYILAFSKDTVRQNQENPQSNYSDFHLEMSQHQQKVFVKISSEHPETITQTSQNFLDNLLLLGHHYLDNIPEITPTGFAFFQNHHQAELEKLGLDSNQLQQAYLWQYLLNESQGYFKDMVNSYEPLIHYVKMNSHLPALTDEQQKITNSYPKI